MKTLSLMSLLATGLIATAAQAEVQTVDYVDLTRYVGKWYEIASIPQSFQKQCVGNVTADYTSLSNGQIQVINTCTKSDGSVSVAEGRAEIVDPVTNAKLKVTFVKFFDWIFSFGGDYWVIGLENNYRYAVVGHPTRDYGWILSREPEMSKGDLLAVSDILKAQGYDTCKLITTVQKNGISERLPLCQYLLK